MKMKKIFLIILIGLTAAVIAGATEESEGKEIWNKLQNEEVKCADLTDDDFELLGEYFMGQMMGESHEAMNNMMLQTMGKEGEEQAHIAMGKRFSACEPEAQIPQNMAPMIIMMNMMMGGWSNPSFPSLSNFNNMMNFGYTQFGWLGFLFMILFWVLVILGIIVLIKCLMGKCRSGTEEKSALEILKERYARGEIDKKEFEEKKKDLI